MSLPVRPVRGERGLRETMGAPALFILIVGFFIIIPLVAIALARQQNAVEACFERGIDIDTCERVCSHGCEG
jgi:hypothetical protein